MPVQLPRRRSTASIYIETLFSRVPMTPPALKLEAIRRERKRSAGASRDVLVISALGLLLIALVLAPVLRRHPGDPTSTLMAAAAP